MATYKRDYGVECSRASFDRSSGCSSLGLLDGSFRASGREVYAADLAGATKALMKELRKSVFSIAVQALAMLEGAVIQAPQPMQF